MAELAAKTAERMPAHAPAAAIDREQLALMTLGDRSLEREVLGLFDRQAVLLLARMHGAQSSALAALAHTLKGSAKSIGAWAVAREAEAVELAAPGTDRDGVLARLAAAVHDARAVIDELTRTH